MAKLTRLARGPREGARQMVHEDPRRRRSRLLAATLASLALSTFVAGGALAAKAVPSVAAVCAWYPGDTTVTWAGFRATNAQITWDYEDAFFIAHSVTLTYDKLKDHSLTVQSPVDTGGARSGGVTARVYDRSGASYSDTVTCS